MLFLAKFCVNRILVGRVCSAATIAVRDARFIKFLAPQINISLLSRAPTATTPSEEVRIEFRGRQFETNMDMVAVLMSSPLCNTSTIAFV